MKKWLDSPGFLFGLLRVVAVAAIAVGVWLSVSCGVVQHFFPEEGAAPVGMDYVITALINCALWCVAWGSFFGMCTRLMKAETAFTVQNVRALGHISLAFVIGGCFLLLLGKPLMDWLLLGMRGFRSPVWWLLPSFAAWTAALLVRAIQVLLKRAVEMQTESDLTV